MLRLGYCWAAAPAASAKSAAAPRTRMADMGWNLLELPDGRAPILPLRAAPGRSRRRRMLVEKPGQPLAQVPVAHRLDVADLGHNPELLRFARSLVQALRMVRRHHQVLLAVNEKHRDRRKRLDRRGRRIVVLHRQAREPLERPGEEESGKLLARDQAIVGKRAVQNDGANAGPVA